MDCMKYHELPAFFQGAADIFAEKKEELCEMDANMGDGDLGLTMEKGFGALPQLIRENGEEGTVMQALFSLKGQEFMCIDSPPIHKFTFTPSFSIFITCDSEEELHYLYDNLLTGGEALMPLDHYGFSKKFGWVNDKFGISWQINLPND